MRRVSVLLVILGMAGALIQAQPVVANGGVLDGAGFIVGQAVAPGSVVSIFGSGLATSLLQGDTIPLSTKIGNTTVTFNGVAAPLYFVSDGQVNAQLPWNVLPQGVTSGTANVVVTVNGVASVAKAVSVAPVSPNMFSLAGSGFAIAINPDGSLAAPAGSIPGFPARPAKSGDALILLANGLGPVDSAIASGAPGLPVRNTTTVPQVLIGGVGAVVQFSGLSPQFPGINQINIVVPSGVSGNAVPLQIRTGGIISSDKVIIAVGP
jgi:uncharacterized protein (TIGR03437 family)